jgi:S1-C subfamily serine protease
MLGIEGVHVLEVQPGSPAAQAGLVSARFAADGSYVPGDVIVAVDGKRVASVGELLGRLDDYKVGDTVKLAVRRDGRVVEVAVTLQPSA